MRFQTESAGGLDGGHAEGVGERNAKAEHVTESAIEREGAAGEAALSITADAALNDHFEIAEAVTPVGHSRGGSGVGDQNDFLNALRGDEQANGGIIHMNAIGDQFGCDARIGENGAEHAGIAVRERTHGVEDVRDVAGAAIDGGAGLFVGGVGVAHGDENAALARRIDQFGRAGKLRSQREETELALGGFVETFEQADRGGGDVSGGMNATARMTDERTFEMNAQNPRATGGAIGGTANVFGNACETAASVVGGSGDSSGENRGGAAARNRMSDGSECFRRGFHHVMSGGAVNVQIEERGSDAHRRSRGDRSAGGQGDRSTRAGSGDMSSFDDDACFLERLERGEQARRVNNQGAHDSRIMLLEKRG